MLTRISHSFALLTREISWSTLEIYFIFPHITCIILYLISILKCYCDEKIVYPILILSKSIFEMRQNAILDFWIPHLIPEIFRFFEIRIRTVMKIMTQPLVRKSVYTWLSVRGRQYSGTICCTFLLANENCSLDNLGCIREFKNDTLCYYSKGMHWCREASACYILQYAWNKHFSMSWCSLGTQAWQDQFENEG